MIMVHGRGASAEDILSLSEELSDSGIAFLAPQAAGSVWYPQTFLSPLAANEPGLSSALAVVASVEGRAKRRPVSPPSGSSCWGFPREPVSSWSTPRGMPGGTAA